MNTINPESLPQIVWQNQKVLTTELLAQCYEAEQHQIRQNYINNKDRFIEGNHFFKLEGDDLKTFKDMVSANFGITGYVKTMLQNGLVDSTNGTHRVDIIYSVKIANNVNSLMLWTEKGAVRHAKILDTDKAWEVQERLEEFYFYPERRASITQDTQIQHLGKLHTLQSEHSQLQDKYIGLLEDKVAWLEQQSRAKPKRENKGNVSEAEVLQILRLHAQGLSNTAIAKQIGRSNATVSFIVRGAKGGVA